MQALSLFVLSGTLMSLSQSATSPAHQQEATTQPAQPKSAVSQPAAPRPVEPAIVPRPAELALKPGWYAPLTISLSYEDGEQVLPVARYLAEVLSEANGVQFAIPRLPEKPPPPGSVVPQPPDARIFGLWLDDTADLGDEGYELNIPNFRNAVLKARTPAGLFHGVQTIRQLLQPRTEDPDPRSPSERKLAKNSNPYPPDDPYSRMVLPCVEIQDQPRYAHRGMLLDCCRHFMSKDFVKRYIDLLAYHKMNVLHWHLTEDQGWRIEIKKYPKLTEIGAWRGEGKDRHGGFYTQDDIREIVAYAKSRYITIIPEIEMPGHSTAALASYPELSCTGGPFKVGEVWGVFEDVYCAGDDRTFEFLQDVLTEVMELFPSEYIHIGGDECPKMRWQKCPKCQARIKAEGLKDEGELQSYFIRRVEKFLNRKGRRLIGWDEILEGGLAPNATVQSWRGLDGAIAAAKSGHDVICSPTSHCYLDYAQAELPGLPSSWGYVPLEVAYAFEPTPPELTPEQARHVLGLEGNIWTERVPQERVDVQVFPRLCALAEVGWSPKESRDWADFSRRMKAHYRRLDALGVTYFIPLPRFKTGDATFTDSLEVAFDEPFQDGEIRYTTDGTDPGPASPKYAASFRLTKTTPIKARNFLKNGRTSETAARLFRKMAPVEPVHAGQTQAGLSFEYYEGTWDRLPDFSKLRPEAVGEVESFSTALKRRPEQYAIRFTGFIEIPVDGRYTFHVISDDGSRLSIGSEVVVDHDGPHPPCEKSGQIILQKGKHPICVEFFDGGGANSLSVSFEGPGIARQPIPAQVLSHSPK